MRQPTAQQIEAVGTNSRDRMHERKLGGVQRLFVATSGPLGGLPLGLLVTTAPAAGEDDADPAVLARTAWLSDRYALVTLPSVTSLRVNPVSVCVATISTPGKTAPV